MMHFILKKLGFFTHTEEFERGRKTLVLWVIEELMFWGGFFVLLTGSGWVSSAGGVFVLASIVFAFALLY